MTAESARFKARGRIGGEYGLGNRLRGKGRRLNTETFSSERHKSTSPEERLLSSGEGAIGRRTRTSASTRDQEVHP